LSVHVDQRNIFGRQQLYYCMLSHFHSHDIWYDIHIILSHM
jgi:hypothetical protein